MNRSQLVKLIHVAKRDRRLDDDTYRQLLIKYTELDSTKYMEVKQLQQVMNAMKSLGFRVKSKLRTAEQCKSADKQSAMIRGIWLELADRGVIRDRSDRAMNAFIYRCTGIGRLEWISSQQSSQVIEQLKKWRNRVQNQAPGNDAS
ncbi:Mu-like prophage protein gp16 [Yersinia pseudotuberculosis]|uniref:gp16 family protein n=1 Tax=Yersinia pseudotuberculosis complex TaxID=1649845 RepID=UPI0004F88463|nr:MULTISPECIES: regulatory protein GemA [Yersinia pseudotuberculosis complex]AIN15263.1 hypothetical protein DJ40_4239 [Yersinia pseudotuberculosis]AJJ07622.1 hypothetical protein BZ20_3873 [Yersinia pseudotuberculosis]MBO1548734.1 DUF1018 domain-containing protein [Yersinia pseudotuberculosis]MBO1554590.1 DUF1018 domain-containing protein [Yersinia pseudotuberculosis]MBO1561846.1 DUF1018 domain-containing protein [Yersinia pseudotuberculosis]